MFSKTKNIPLALQTARKTVPSVLSADVNILGNLISDGFVDFDGRIEGSIKCFSATIRPNAKIRGDVIAETVHVYGSVQGVIKAKNVHLFAGCRVQGIIMHEALSIEDGAFVDGKFKRTDKIFIEDEDALQIAIDAENDEDERMRPFENIRLISEKK